MRRGLPPSGTRADRKSTRLNSSHEWISYAVFCLKKKKSVCKFLDASLVDEILDSINVVFDAVKYVLDLVKNIQSVSDRIGQVFDALSFFFTQPATREIYTLSLHDALPI